MRKRGSVLVFSLIVMAVTVIVTGGLCSYYVTTMHTAHIFEHQRSTRRVGAARALRKTFDSVLAKLPTGSDAGSAVTLNTQGKTMAEVLKDMKSAVPKTVKIENVTYTLKTEEVDGATLKITAYVDGVSVASVTIELESSAVLNTLPVFDYVYFVDNNGRLDSSYIIANGEVGSNGDFELAGATVNGYVRYRNTLRLTDDPHAWLQGAYMSKIAAEFMTSTSAKSTIEQARPTNPTTYVENGVTKEISWPGGYEPIEAKNPYTFNDKAPDPVPDPGDPPEKPSEDDIISTTTKP